MTSIRFDKNSNTFAICNNSDECIDINMDSLVDWDITASCSHCEISLGFYSSSIVIKESEKYISVDGNVLSDLYNIDKNMVINSESGLTHFKITLSLTGRAYEDKNYIEFYGMEDKQ